MTRVCGDAGVNRPTVLQLYRSIAHPVTVIGCTGQVYGTALSDGHTVTKLPNNAFLSTCPVVKWHMTVLSKAQ